MRKGVDRNGRRPFWCMGIEAAYATTKVPVPVVVVGS